MSKIEYLDPEIAGEGESADNAPWVQARPHVYDYAAFKEHKHYGRYFQDPASLPFRPYPAWIYHQNEAPKIVGDAKTAEKYGVSYDKEEGRYLTTGDWRIKPFEKIAANATDTGKNLILPGATQSATNSFEVLSQILQEMRVGNKDAPKQAIAIAIQDDPDYQEFMAFKAFKDAAGKGAPKESALDPHLEKAQGGLPEAEQKALLIEAANERGVAIKKNWSIDRIKEELDKVAA